MKDRVFFDTNILVYAHIEQNITKQQKVKRLIEDRLNKPVFISIQVINEFYSVLQKNKIGHLIIKQNIFELNTQFNISEIDFELIIKALEIKEKYFFSLWDCLIIASALQNNCSILYTEDMQHNQIIENTLKIVNPFK